MTISAQIILDSVSPAGKRHTTLQLRYPKFVHGEFLTHRALSRNSSSSRAIPFARMVQDVLKDPAMPVWWGAEQKGMQARAELGSLEMVRARGAWLRARDLAVDIARSLAMCGLHKQIVNRVLEPYMHINTLVTATEYDNFFALRCHPDAQPEIRVLAEAMRDAMVTSKPTLLQPGQWHLPYVTQDDLDQARSIHGYSVGFGNSPWSRTTDRDRVIIELRRVSVARCARVSYLTHDGRPTTVEEDLALYERLVGSVPRHASPAEHQATPDENAGGVEPGDARWAYPQEHGNFVGWRQYRRQLELGVGADG